MTKFPKFEIGNEKTAREFETINGKKPSRINGKADSWRASLALTVGKQTADKAIINAALPVSADDKT